MDLELESVNEERLHHQPHLAFGNFVVVSSRFDAEALAQRPIWQCGTEGIALSGRGLEGE
jgi:hypothetical protein